MTRPFQITYSVSPAVAADLDALGTDALRAAYLAPLLKNATSWPVGALVGYDHAAKMVTACWDRESNDDIAKADPELLAARAARDADPTNETLRQAVRDRAEVVKWQPRMDLDGWAFVSSGFTTALGEAEISESDPAVVDLVRRTKAHADRASVDLTK